MDIAVPVPVPVPVPVAVPVNQYSDVRYCAMADAAAINWFWFLLHCQAAQTM